MDDIIEIPVVYKGEDHVFNAKMVNYGYTRRIQVQVNGRVITLEQDEEQRFRAITDQKPGDTFSIVERDLIIEIISVLDSLR